MNVIMKLGWLLLGPTGAYKIKQKRTRLQMKVCVEFSLTSKKVAWETCIDLLGDNNAEHTEIMESAKSKNNSALEVLKWARKEDSHKENTKRCMPVTQNSGDGGRRIGHFKVSLDYIGRPCPRVGGEGGRAGKEGERGARGKKSSYYIVNT